MSTVSEKLTPRDYDNCENCDGRAPTCRMRDGTGDPGDPGVVLCDECHAEFKRSDMDPVQR